MHFPPSTSPLSITDNILSRFDPRASSSNFSLFPTQFLFRSHPPPRAPVKQSIYEKFVIALRHDFFDRNVINAKRKSSCITVMIVENIGTKNSCLKKTKQNKQNKRKQEKKKRKKKSGLATIPENSCTRERHWHASKKGPHPHRPACVSQGSKFEQLYIGRKKSWSREKPVEREKERERKDAWRGRKKTSGKRTTRRRRKRRTRREWWRARREGN